MLFILHLIFFLVHFNCFVQLISLFSSELGTVPKISSGKRYFFLPTSGIKYPVEFSKGR